MRAVVVRKIGSFHLEEIPIPEPENNEALIKVEVAGVWRTDLKIIEQGPASSTGTGGRSRGRGNCHR